MPGATSYRPFWVALGTIALELLLAVALANVLRKRIGHMRWRRVHYLTFGVWFASTVHGIGAGTDATAGWLRVLYLVSIGSVALATVWRVGARRLPPRVRQRGVHATDEERRARPVPSPRRRSSRGSCPEPETSVSHGESCTP